MLAMASLLIHDDRVPSSARDILKAASSASPEYRGALLRSAARILHDEVDLDCIDARELVGLEH
jgi:hypothetical protein